MAASTLSRSHRNLHEAEVLPAAAAFGAVVLGTLLLMHELQGRSMLLVGAFGVALAAGTFCFLSTRYTLTLGILMVFLGLADGYLKLRFGGLAVTALRDVLLFSIAAGALTRIATSGEPIRWPPLTVLVLAWVAVVLVQLGNPANGTLQHSILSLRSHIEWVPLFFFGYALMQTKRSLYLFLTLLLVLTAINGLVSLYQYQAGPEAIAGWGPGYEKLIFGGGAVAGRTFVDAAGVQQLRPPGLGSDTGFAGVLAVLGGPAAFVFVMLGRRRLLQVLGVVLAGGVLVAVLTAQIRIAIVGLVVAMGSVALLSAVSRKLGQTILAAAAVAVVALIVGSFVSGKAGAGIFDRYASLRGNGAVGSTVNYKQTALNAVPDVISNHPFGAGFGSVGAAASIRGAPEYSRLANGESELNFLTVEVGLPGLLVLLAFHVTVVMGSVRRIRRLADPELRLLLGAVVSPLIAMLVLWFGGPISGAPPLATYLWFASGVLAYWCFGGARAPDDASPAAASS